MTTVSVPSIGRILHMYLPDNPEQFTDHRVEGQQPRMGIGALRPAIVTRVIDEQTVDLIVFLDGNNDAVTGPFVRFMPSVVKDGGDRVPGTWKWPALV